jgi:hypothetical protein
VYRERIASVFGISLDNPATFVIASHPPAYLLQVAAHPTVITSETTFHSAISVLHNFTSAQASNIQPLTLHVWSASAFAARSLHHARQHAPSTSAPSFPIRSSSVIVIDDDDDAAAAQLPPSSQIQPDSTDRISDFNPAAALRHAGLEQPRKPEQNEFGPESAGEFNLRVQEWEEALGNYQMARYVLSISVCTSLAPSLTLAQSPRSA